MQRADDVRILAHRFHVGTVAKPAAHLPVGPQLERGLKAQGRQGVAEAFGRALIWSRRDLAADLPPGALYAAQATRACGNRARKPSREVVVSARRSSRPLGIGGERPVVAWAAASVTQPAPLEEAGTLELPEVTPDAVDV